MRKVPSHVRHPLHKVSFVVLTILFTVVILQLGAIFVIRPATAAYSQVDQPQITLNPGGGILENGSDGLRFTINSDDSWEGGYPEEYDYAIAGQDGVVYRGTYQYCCSAGGPMLNIGGSLYGQSGPAYWGVPAWSSIEILSTSGATSVGARTPTTGNSAATIRYTVVHDELTYTINRTVAYTYPNDYVTDTYTFTIPAGNTDVVKFYLGGDTAPGSSDSGYGVMLTEPVRSVISLNTSSSIMFGFREISSSKPFDGATSQHYGNPYGTVGSGGDIGFVVTEDFHDAGLMMQWNLGSTPGVQTASLQQFSTKQGTNLNAIFSSNTTQVGDPVNINISIANTELVEADELGFTFALPTNLVVGSGSPSNSCGGTLTAMPGSSTISLSDGEVDAAANCVISVPVVSDTNGVYTISPENFSELENLTNNVGVSSLTVLLPGDGDGDGIDSEVEDAAPNDGDANDDGTPDSEQSNVASFISPENNKYVSLAIDEECDITSVSIIDASGFSTSDAGFEYPSGFLNFTADCGFDNFTTEVKIFKYGVASDGLILRKYNPGEEIYFTIEDAEIVEEVIDDQIVTIATYSITDGEELDMDGEVNGIIVDPVGLASVFTAQADPTPTTSLTPTENTVIGAPTTGLPSINMSTFTGMIFIGIGLLINKINAARHLT